MFTSNPQYNFFLKQVLTILVIWACIQVTPTIQPVLLILILSGFLAILLNPLVNFGKRKRIPAWLTVATVYIMVLILIFFILGTFIPLLIDYISIGITGFVKWLQDIQIAYTNEGISAFHLPYVVERGLTFLVGENKVEGIFNLLQANAKEIQAFLAEQAKNITSGTVNIGSSVIGFLSTFIFVGIATFLLVLERREVGRFILNITPLNIAQYLKRSFPEIEDILNSWIRGQLILCLSIGGITLIGLTLIEVFMGVSFDKKGTLATIAGIMEFIPYMGPILALVPALVVALGISWELTVVVMIFYIAVQQLENNILVPVIMSKSLDLSPFYIFITMVAGGLLAGVLGIILALPIAAIIQKLVTDYLEMKKAKEGTVQLSPEVKPDNEKKVIQRKKK